MAGPGGHGTRGNAVKNGLLGDALRVALDAGPAVQRERRGRAGRAAASPAASTTAGGPLDGIGRLGGGAAHSVGSRCARSSSTVIVSAVRS